MSITKPFNLNQWIKDNKHLLKPPVGNKNLYVDSGDYIVMIVGGPNARKDYHYNETEELFYQLEGEITVYIQEDGEKKAMKLSGGDMYIQPKSRIHLPEPKILSVWLSNENAPEKVLPMVCFGFATTATTNFTKPILNFTTSKKTFYRISNIITTQKI
jgi:3-hydroxyanthranilate 3,4-dioxygenase